MFYTGNVRNFTGVLRAWTGSATFGVNVTYSCPNEYSFDGLPASAGLTHVVTCQPSGSWLPMIDNLTCMPVKYCNPAGLPDTSNNMTLVITNYSDNNPVRVMDIFEYLYLDHTDFYTCLANGSWKQEKTGMSRCWLSSMLNSVISKNYRFEAAYAHRVYYK